MRLRAMEHRPPPPALNRTGGGGERGQDKNLAKKETRLPAEETCATSR